MRVAKSKALISFTVTAKLICVFVFAYAKKPGFFMTRHKSIFTSFHKTILHN